MPEQRILLLEDEKLIRWSVRERLAGEGYRVGEAQTGEEALRRLTREDWDLLLLDHRLVDTTGLEILRWVRAERPELMVVMMTAFGTEADAIEAMKLGAFQYLTKPVNLDELSLVVQEALEMQQLRRELEQFRRERKTVQEKIHLVGQSAALQEIRSRIETLAVCPARPILLVGELGTGKNLVGKAIHQRGMRAGRPFVTVPCRGVSGRPLDMELFGQESCAGGHREGLLELVAGGTLFLDKIGEMDLSVQGKLLRVLREQTFRRMGGRQDIPLDVAVIAATRLHLEDAVLRGRFLRGLHHQLMATEIDLPPLRRRREDIPLLVEHLRARFAAELQKDKLQFSPGAVECLVQAPWPGNIRELMSVIKRVMILQERDVIEAADLSASLRMNSRPPAVAPSPRPGALRPGGSATLESLEREAIQAALKKTGHNQVQAARLLGITRDRLRYRLRKLGLAVPARSRRPR
ncbi:MAG: sigma-54-dependent transcriptional regulator [Acidobacteriota bacterium]